MVLVPSHDLRPAKGEANGLPMLDLFPSRNMPPPVRKRKPSTKPRDALDQEQYFVSLVVDKENKVRVRSSSSLKQFADYIVGDACRRILECVPRDLTPLEGDANGGTVNFPPVAGAPSSFIASDYGAGTVSFPFKRPAKRHRSGTSAADKGAKKDEEPSSSCRSRSHKGRKLIELRAGDSAGMHKWYAEAFHAVQQVTCRLVAKVWIKRIHPKKQSTNPYNGGHPKDRDPDPDRTKPYWWPPRVKHKEPDHINKEARVELLRHIIELTPLRECNASDERGTVLVSANQLLEALEEKRNDVADDKWEILQCIASARTLQEQFDEGQADENYSVWVVDCSCDTRRSQGEADDEVVDGDNLPRPVPDGSGEHAEQRAQDELQMTPISSNLTSPTEDVCTEDMEAMPLRDDEPAIDHHASFHSNYVKAETARRQSETYVGTGDRQVTGGHRSQHVSPSVEMTQDEFEERVYQPSHDRMIHGTQIGHYSDLQHHHHAPENALNHWPMSMPPSMFLAPTYATHNLQPQRMLATDSSGFGGEMYHPTAAPPPTRQSTGVHELPFGQGQGYAHAFDGIDQRGLPLRPASVFRHNVMPHDLEMMQGPYYPL